MFLHFNNIKSVKLNLLLLTWFYEQFASLKYVFVNVYWQTSVQVIALVPGGSGRREQESSVTHLASTNPWPAPNSRKLLVKLSQRQHVTLSVTSSVWTGSLRRKYLPSTNWEGVCSPCHLCFLWLKGRRGQREDVWRVTVVVTGARVEEMGTIEFYLLTRACCLIWEKQIDIISER